MSLVLLLEGVFGCLTLKLLFTVPMNKQTKKI